MQVDNLKSSLLKNFHPLEKSKWIALVSIITMIGLWFYLGFITRLDLVFYDKFLQSLSRPASAQILIIKIDNKSIQRIGRWPWSREKHAQLLNIIGSSKPKAIGFDILFSEPESMRAEADMLFAKAIQSNKNVILALAPEQYARPGQAEQKIVELLPLSLLAEPAAALGHVDFETDIDGVSRRVYLYAGQDSPHWPSLSLALSEQALGTSLVSPANIEQASSLSSSWMRSTPYLIPFSGAAGSFASISYIDVLDNKIPASQFKDKIILIGATASGLGDSIATPFSSNHQLMSGVEYNANIIAGLLDRIFIVELSQGFSLLLTAVVLLIFYGLIQYKNGRYASRMLVIGLFFSFGLSAVLLKWAQLWYPPTLLIIGLISVYILWGWHRLKYVARWVEKLKQQIEFYSLHDEVTALPNRKKLHYEIEQAISTRPKAIENDAANTQELDKHSALMAISLGRYKILHDRFGYKVADEVLEVSSKRIQKVLESNQEAYFLARLNAGEFGIFIHHIADEHELRHLGAMILHALEPSFSFEEQDFYMQPSIGVATYPNDAENVDKLFNHAVTAMHQAKRDRSQGLFFFSYSKQTALFNQLDLESDIHLAVEKGQFELFYQSQHQACSGDIIGLEALLRWNHPLRGLIPPDDFIPLAEYTGDILNIGQWVLEQACLQGVKWHRQGHDNLRIAVNVSSLQFAQDDFFDNVKEILKRTGFPAKYLELELTETTLMADWDKTSLVLSKLKELGIGLSVDDFGTGYSSLNYLTRFAVDRIKIDKSFICELAQNEANFEVVATIINMAHRLDMEVIAEGVETQLQQALLVQQNCEELQGYYFSRPLPVHELETLFRHHRQVIAHTAKDEVPASARQN